MLEKIKEMTKGEYTEENKFKVDWLALYRYLESHTVEETRKAYPIVNFIW